MADDKQLSDALFSHGESLAVGLEIIASDFLNLPDLHIEHGPVRLLGPGQRPDDCPRRGILLTHAGELAPPSQGSFSLGWFFPESLKELITQGADEGELSSKLQVLASQFAENLGSDKYTLTESLGSFTEDMWGDYLRGDLPPYIAWQKFKLTGVPMEELEAYLAWPKSVLDRMYGTPLPTAATAPSVESTPSVPTPPKPTRSLSPAVLRLLRTQVPVIVTLAQKHENAGKLLQLGPGSIIEFSQSCEEPLQFSVNNLPIGIGEAVKIGDHFGLKVISIVPPEERLERLGGKWPY
ncbi:FliM/FliN family flagellar motor C-terminal domain-containing protein [bacterium]|nr:FliM/FliN family flagellar motor C-terminal domain-containing protein [bacterium]